MKENGERGLIALSVRYLFAVTVVALTVIAKISQGLLIEEAKIVRHIQTAQKVIALTFDDGPNPKTTPEVLNVLREKNVKATFFILGENAKQYPEIAAKVASEGHEIGSHSYTHRHLKDLDEGECARELDQAEEIIGTFAPRPQLFRPPGGLYNDTVLKEAEKRGYTTALWSVDPTDWQRPSVQYVVKTVVDNAKSGGIILLHDGIYPTPTPKAIAIVIDRLRSEGYTFVTISELLSYEAVKETGL